MTDYSKLSDREVDALVAGMLDGYVWLRVQLYTYPEGPAGEAVKEWQRYLGKSEDMEAPTSTLDELMGGKPRAVWPAMGDEPMMGEFSPWKGSARDADDWEPTLAYAWKCPCYTASFDEALRLLREMDAEMQRTACNRLERAMTLHWRRYGGLVATVLLYATPRDICEAMLEAKGVTL